MKQLMQAQGERCAKACGEGGKMELYEWRVGGPSTGIGEYITIYEGQDWVYRADEIPDIMGLSYDSVPEMLPLDPCFWFSRLWDKLDYLTGPDFGDPEPWRLESLKRHGDYRVYIGDIGGFHSNHPCMAMCAAIEALEKE